MSHNDLTPQEQERLEELLKITIHSTALEILAIERGEHPDLWCNGKPLPWPPPEEEEPEP